MNKKIIVVVIVLGMLFLVGFRYYSGKQGEKQQAEQNKGLHNFPYLTEPFRVKLQEGCRKQQH